MPFCYSVCHAKYVRELGIILCFYCLQERGRNKTIQRLELMGEDCEAYFAKMESHIERHPLLEDVVLRDSDGRRRVEVLGGAMQQRAEEGRARKQRRIAEPMQSSPSDTSACPER